MAKLRMTRIPQISAMYYGPFGLLRALAIGFVLGSVVFLAVSMLRLGSEHDFASQLRTWFYFIGAGCGLSLALTMILNFKIGRRVQQDMEHQRKLFRARAQQFEGTA